MKNINAKVSDDSHKIITNYKLDKKLKTMDEALDKFIQEHKK